MAISKSAWYRRYLSEASEMRQTARVQRAERIRDISLKWKEGFAALKAENDRLQREAAEEYGAELIRIQGWINQKAVEPPPAE